jgi:acetyl esterase/lipase
VVAIDFRQPPGAHYPASIADANLGTRWLKGGRPAAAVHFAAG